MTKTTFIKTAKKGKVGRGFRPKNKDVKDEVEQVKKGSLLERVEEELASEGIKVLDDIEVDNQYLILPPNLTELESRELGRHFGAFTAQKVYVRTMLGKTRALLREINEELDILKEAVYKTLPAKMSVTEKELRLKGNENPSQKKTLELMEKKSFLEEKCNMLADYLENLVDIIFALSREVSRREGDWNDSNRGESLNKGKGRR